MRKTNKEFWARWHKAHSEGVSYSVIADAYGVPKNTVASGLKSYRDALNIPVIHRAGGRKSAVNKSSNDKIKGNNEQK